MAGFDSPRRKSWVRTYIAVELRSTWDFTILPGQALPRGYLWADPRRQVYGMGGPHLVYAPLTRCCRDCAATFTWSARAQQHLYETLRLNIETTAMRCQPCARQRRALEAARARYAAALDAVRAAPTASGHARVAALMLEILERGGRVAIARALGHCTRARRLGASTSVDAIEARLRARARP